MSERLARTEQQDGKTRRAVRAALGALLLAGGLSACGTTPGGESYLPDRSIPTVPVTTPARSWPLIRMEVINSRDSSGREVGVITYEGPTTNRRAGLLQGGKQPFVDCEAAGRTVTDTNVPRGEQATVSTSWYRVVADEGGALGQPEWIGNGYAQEVVAAGEVPPLIPGCTPEQIAGVPYDKLSSQS